MIQLFRWEIFMFPHCRHTLFKERPCIPAMFLVHERKLTKTHEEMFKVCTARIPALRNTTSPLVTDKEKSITNAVKQQLPSVPLIHCWNHILRDIRHWLHQHGAPATDTAVYMEDTFQLLHSPSKKEYDRQLAEVRQRWDVLFVDYYMKNIHEDVPTALGRWILESLQVYHPYSGVTNNQSEGFNRVMKDLQGWKEAPLDCVVLSLYLLQAYYTNEIKRGLAGTGEYHIIPSMKASQLDHFRYHFLPTANPNEIVDSIRSRKSLEEVVIQEKPGQPNTSDAAPTRGLSAHARACQVLSKDHISFDPKLHVFNVKGTSGITRVVSLYPHQTCSCPSTSECYHILATKYSIGIQPTAKSKQSSGFNLSQLRKNTRSRRDKKSGRKRPRQNDVEPVTESKRHKLQHQDDTGMYSPVHCLAETLMELMYTQTHTVIQ